jgi:hypothetical protein
MYPVLRLTQKARYTGKANNAERNQQQSLLLRLPAEIRNRIFSLAMDLDQPGRSHSDHSVWETPPWDRLELSRSCRQIFAETAETYFERWLLGTRNCRTEIANTSTYPEEFKYHIATSHRRVVLRAIMFWYDLVELGFDPDEPCPLAQMVSLEHAEVQFVSRRWTCSRMWGEMQDHLRVLTGKPKLKVIFKNFNE